ncbi:MAG: hypothetical protein KME25_34055 [Symplocastrum torsivum CPER-KK1]|jgi:hypothetical protein|uniref:Uncharacterized protein n=1 Tax=Symplocastrum torsivum CPER-KK1 TaxID=450513 RepID=A0A951PUS3_9CYAN|nr:hypothetical protein [Symplocastrum torsivum CPER-KK1]
MQNKLIRQSRQSTDPSSATHFEIPKHLPPTVRDVAESLLMRDPEGAKRYLEAHLNQRSRVGKDDSILDLIGDN